MKKGNYNCEDFTEFKYQELLEIAKTKYTFENFNSKSSQKHVIWRHDVDFSMHRAVKLAQIESQQGVSAIYFIMLRSEFYNFFERDIQNCIRKILSLGHNIGLHFDISYYSNDICSEKLEQALEHEANIIEKELSISIDSFSFHNTNDVTKTFTKDYYGKFFNVYSQSVQNKYKYCSDSNGYWRFERLEDIIKKDNIDFLQVLTHPVWWVSEPMLPRERVKRAIEGRAQRIIKIYDDLLEASGRINAGKT